MVDVGGSCSHGRVRELYIDSIKNQNVPGYFESTQCLSYNAYQDFECEDNLKVLMGEKASDFAEVLVAGKPKKFFLDTEAAAPFSVKQEL